MTLTEPTEAKAKTPGKTPAKKMKKFTAKKWDFMDENELDALESQHIVDWPE